MEKKTAVIDRATLLASSGTAALATLLMGATKSKKGWLCCDPIDLTYENPNAMKSTKHSKSSSPCPKTINGVRLVTQKSNQPCQPNLSGWTNLGLISNAQLDGDDQDGHKGIKQSFGYNVWVYMR